MSARSLNLLGVVLFASTLLAGASEAAPPAPATQSITLSDAVYAKPYRVQLSFPASNANPIYPPFTFSIVSGSGALPSCLKLDPETNILSGTPSNACRGTYSFMVVETDLHGNQTQQRYVVHVTDGKTTVAPEPPPAAAQPQPAAAQPSLPAVQPQPASPPPTPPAAQAAVAKPPATPPAPTTPTNSNPVTDKPVENKPGAGDKGGAPAVVNPQATANNAAPAPPVDCTNVAINQQIAAPAFDKTTLDAGNKVAITGTIPAPAASSSTAGANTPDEVRVCVNGAQYGDPVKVDSSKFTGITIATLNNGDAIFAQVVRTSSTSTSESSTPAPEYGQRSSTIVVGACSAVGSSDVLVKPPAVNAPPPGSQTVKINIPLLPKDSQLRVCIDDRQPVIADIDHSGNYSASLDTPIRAGQHVTIQEFTPVASGSPAKYGLPSDPGNASGHLYSGFFGSFIGGAEQSGYSSDNINTNAFVSAFFRSGYFHPEKERAIAIWGRIRLLSAPQQSAPNIISTFTNASGQITQSSLSSVGAVTDYSLGGEYRLWQEDSLNQTTSRISLIAGIGETTPLNTATPSIFNAPAATTAECANFLHENLTLTSGSSLSTPGCIENTAAGAAYKYIAYTQQKRTDFFFKYGAGVRLSRVFPARGSGGSPYADLLDITLGQDQSITGGKTAGMVFRLDGQYALPYGSLSSIYFFGSSSVRLRENQNLTTITLAPATGAPTLPDPTVLVLPTAQPNRDFYRIGVGLNLIDLFSSVFKGPSTTQTTKTTN